MQKPYWLMYPPKKYYQFRRQTLSNWIDLHTHQADDHDKFVSVASLKCRYCGQTGKDELWWNLPTCKGQAWHIRNMYKPGGPQAFGQHAKNTDNPYYKRG